MRSAVLILLFMAHSVNAQGAMTFEQRTDCFKTWKKTGNLHIEYQYYVGINDTNNRIEAAFGMRFRFNQNIDFLEDAQARLPVEHNLLRRTDLKWTIFYAVTFRHANGQEVLSDDIDYGYDPNKMHNNNFQMDTGAVFSDVTEPFKEHPFRFSKIRIKYSQSINGKPLIDLEAKCDNTTVNARAWISSPGLYRLVIPKENKNDFYFENIYYWPRPKQILT